MSFPPLVIPVKTTLQVPALSTFSEAHNETLPTAEIHAVAVRSEKEHFPRRGDFIGMVDTPPKVGSKRSDPQKTYKVVMAGDPFPQTGIRAMFPIAEAVQIKKNHPTFVAAAVGGVQEIRQGSTVVNFKPGDRVYATLGVKGGEIEFQLGSSGDCFVGTCVNCSPDSVVTTI